MGTPPRLDYDGAFQHVYNRGARRDLIFFDDTDRHAWLRSVADVCLHRGAEIHAWCLMGNHFHLLLRSPGNVRDVMRDAGSQYVKAFNRRHGLDGPLHTSRYKNEIIESDKQFVTTSRYIHRNPLEIHSGPLRRYQWSSYPFFLAPSAAPRWLHTARTLDMFDGDCVRYGNFVEDADHAGGVVWVPDLDLSFTPPASLGNIIAAVADVAGVGPATLLAGRAGVRSPARLAVCVLALEFDITPHEVARALGYLSSSSVRSSVYRGQKRLGTDRSFLALVDSARRALSEDSADAAAA